MTEKLLPCPFCASPGKIISVMGEWVGPPENYGPAGARVVCSNSHCSGCAMPFHGDDKDQKAASAWNTRHAHAPAAGPVPMPVLETQIERLRKNDFAGMETMRTFALGIIGDLLPQSAASTIEPVGYLHTHPRHGRELDFMAITDGDRRNGWDETPLYAAPTTSPEPPTSKESLQVRSADAVRGLDWQETFVDRGDGSQETSGWEADSGFGVWYEIKMGFGSDSYCWPVYFDSEVIADCDDSEQAKARAQNHYADKIIAALSAPVAGAWPTREQIATELVAHGEFSSLPGNRNYENALTAADAIMALPRNDRVASQPDTDAVTIVAPPIPSLLQREWMAQALFEVDAPDHLEWDDAGIDKRERYLALADTAIAKAAVLTGSPRNEREGGAK